MASELQKRFEWQERAQEAEERLASADELLRQAWHTLALATTGRDREFGESVIALRTKIRSWRKAHHATEDRDG